ncbi:hypothetical protein [Streptomyces hydrogenans]|uniref:hypothetical protein n=1 Tax=Streptomyces hydrogenans TaxID=1873719 RepID=UPI0036ED5D3F
MRIPPTARALLHEYHRRQTHLDKRPAHLTETAAEQIRGELIGLRGAVGIALGEKVGEGADKAAAQLYTRWRDSGDAAAAACTCETCTPGGLA